MRLTGPGFPSDLQLSPVSIRLPPGIPGPLLHHADPGAELLRAGIQLHLLRLGRAGAGNQGNRITHS